MEINKVEKKYTVNLGTNTTYHLTEDDAVELRDALIEALVDTNR